MVWICQQKKLLANEKNKDQMCENINAKSLDFLSLEGLYKALIKEKRNSNFPQFGITILPVSIQ